MMAPLLLTTMMGEELLLDRATEEGLGRILLGWTCCVMIFTPAKEENWVIIGATTTSQSLQQSQYCFLVSSFSKENKRGESKETKTETIIKLKAFVHEMKKKNRQRDIIWKQEVDGFVASPDSCLIWIVGFVPGELPLLPALWQTAAPPNGELCCFGDCCLGNWARIWAGEPTRVLGDGNLAVATFTPALAAPTTTT